MGENKKGILYGFINVIKPSKLKHHANLHIIYLINILIHAHLFTKLSYSNLKLSDKKNYPDRDECKMTGRYSSSLEFPPSH